MPEALKPCPFCGAAASGFGNAYGTGFIIGCSADCVACPCIELADKAEAITAWNTRTADPEIARLQDLVAKFQRGGVSTLFAEGNVDG